MRQHLVELIGYCLGFVGALAQPAKPEEPISLEYLGLGPGDRYKNGFDRGADAWPIIELGGILLDRHSGTRDQRRPLGPVRVVASFG